ncbi:MAG TPA: M14 family zinc carboxypeptidase [Solirubrobacteraceae bacterium]|nr:M14 family zinc carboxypeptidase [Solirubrobacteraceae bacterium]
MPTPESALGFPLGIGQPQPVTSEQIGSYVQAVDAASDRVISFDIGTTWGGRPLKVAVVSSREHMRPAELRRIRERFVAHREGRSGRGDDLRDSPAIVWLAGNVHGGEKSGADAELKVLYELAARTDCESRKLNDDLVTVIMPSQNPDGREASRRQNDYGFDLNRDWFARTQPETEAKVELLRRWPGQVFVDAHEMGGRQYFFPPNADPIHHEIADEPVSWINGIGEANKAAFGYNGKCPEDDNNPSTPAPTECYFNYSAYDLFFMGYGDTVPTTGFGAAGMTYEKGSASPTELRVDQQFRTHWATVRWASQNRAQVLDGWTNIWAQAEQEGEQGVLQPNEVVAPGHTVDFPVPDIRIRSYFLRSDRALGDVRKLVERLRRMDVEVYRLRAPLRLANARVFGGRSAPGTRVPAGSYWIPMNQPQKHWIQATLGEDPYVPFEYFYDVSSWSNPLLMGVPTLYTGDRVRPSAVRVRGLDGGVERRRRARSYEYTLDSSQAGALTFRLLDRGVALRRDTRRNVVSLPARRAPAGLGKLARGLGIDVRASRRRPAGERVPLRPLGLFAGTGISTTMGSYGESRYMIEQRWGLSATTVTAADVNTGSPAFRALGALIVPDGSNPTGGLDAQGQQHLRDWVAAGGVLVGLRRAHNVARSAGLTSTTVKARPPTGYQVIGSHFRVDVDHASPVALGRPREDFQFNNDDPLLNPSTTGVNVLTYPSDDRFWFNGFTKQADLLKGTVALTDEPYGAGHVVLFSYNPVFRAYEESGEHLLANALLYPTGGPALRTLRDETVDGASRAAQPRIRHAEAQAPARNLGGDWRAIRLTVGEAQADATLALVRRYAEPAAVERSGGAVTIVLANPEGLQADEHPFARDLLRALQAKGVELRSAVL